MSTPGADEEWEACKRRLNEFKRKIGIEDNKDDDSKNIIEEVNKDVNINACTHNDCTLKGPKSLYLNCHPLSIPGSCSLVAKTTGAQLPGSGSSKPSLEKRVDNDIGQSLQTDHTKTSILTDLVPQY